MMTNTPIDLNRFRSDLSQALARRAEKLLASVDRADKVAALEPLEAYLIARELGLDQAKPLLLNLTREQVQACVDLSCWHRYDFQATTLAEWLAVFADEGASALARAFFSLDIEVQILFISKTVIIYSFDDPQIPNDDQQETVRAMTPDGRYLLEMREEHPLPINPLGLVGALYQEDEARAEGLITTVHWELPTQVEEDALRFKGHRMHELGFVEAEEATILFTPPRQHPTPRPLEAEDGAVTRLPTLYAQLLGESNLLAQALALVTDGPDRTRLQQELVWTINTAVIAYGETPRDITHLIDIALRVRDTISLGLESLVTHDHPHRPLSEAIPPATALGLMRQWGMRDLFRHGYAATTTLQQETKQALHSPTVAAWYRLPEMEQSDEPDDRQDRAFFRALLGRPPLVGGYDPANADRVRAFASISDINLAQTRLGEIINHHR